MGHRFSLFQEKVQEVSRLITDIHKGIIPIQREREREREKKYSHLNFNCDI